MSSLKGVFNPLFLGAAASSLLLIYGVSSFWSSSSSTSSSLAPALDEKETIEIMTKILNKLKVAANNMLNAHANIKQQIAAQGQQMSDKDIMVNYIFPHFESLIIETQTQVLNEFNVEECEIDESVAYYERSNAEIGDIVYKIKTLYREFGGEVDIEGDSSAGADAEERDFPLEDLIPFLSTLASKMNVAVGSYADAFILQYGLPTSMDMKQSFQLGMMALGEEYENDTFIITLYFKDLLLFLKGSKASAGSVWLNRERPSSESDA